VAANCVGSQTGRVLEVLGAAVAHVPDVRYHDLTTGRGVRGWAARCSCGWRHGAPLPTYDAACDVHAAHVREVTA
jgi:hypothetical protein